MWKTPDPKQQLINKAPPKNLKYYQNKFVIVYDNSQIVDEIRAKRKN